MCHKMRGKKTSPIIKLLLILIGMAMISGIGWWVLSTDFSSEPEEPGPAPSIQEEKPPKEMVVPEVHIDPTVMVTFYIPSEEAIKTRDIELESYDLSYQELLMKWIDQSDKLGRLFPEEMEINFSVRNETLRMDFDETVRSIAFENPQQERRVIHSMGLTLQHYREEFNDIIFLENGERREQAFRYMKTYQPIVPLLPQ